MQGQDLRWLDPAPWGARTPVPPPPAAWRRALLALRYPVWPRLVAGLLLVGLLLLFQRVVAQGVVQGELRRADMAARADSLWRCRLISRLDERNLCLVQRAGS